MLTQSIINWFNTAKPNPTNQDLVKQIAFHFEEFAEMCEAMGDEMHELTMMVRKWKAQLMVYSDLPEQTDKFIANIDKLSLLDAMCDQVVTSIGVMEFMGAKTLRALDEVNQSNYTKFAVGEQGELVPYIKPDGKIGKNPDTYREPELEQYLEIEK